MPSPFPGMDPYLESQTVWSDFHRSFLCEISGLLNRILSSRYYAILRNRIATILSEETTAFCPFIEICDPSDGHAVVTVVEMLDPWCKTDESDQKRYLAERKRRQEMLISLVEIDFLRYDSQSAYGRDAVDYLVTIERRWEDGLESRLVIPIDVRDPLPVIPIPLRESEKEVSLDLQHIFN